jgi:lantibiotic biosynthesis protein
MPTPKEPLYQHLGVALLRAAVKPLGDTPKQWLDPDRPEACRAWLDHVWSDPGLAEAITQASPGLADRVEAIHDNREISAKQLSRATLVTARYLLRTTGRHTPFGLFAGVAPVLVGPVAESRWGTDHRQILRADSEWVADIVKQFEAYPDLLDRLDLVFTNLATRRGGRLEAPNGPNRVSIAHTVAIDLIGRAAASPILFGELVDFVAETFPTVKKLKVRALLVELVSQGLLITCLRVPSTGSEALTHVVDRLHSIRAASLPAVAPLLGFLEALQMSIAEHNSAGPRQAMSINSRPTIESRMRTLSRAGRSPLAVDTSLDAQVNLPARVAREMEWAASALVRLSREPAGAARWRQFYTEFCGRYGTGTLAPWYP